MFTGSMGFVLTLLFLLPWPIVFFFIFLSVFFWRLGINILLIA